MFFFCEKWFFFLKKRTFVFEKAKSVYEKTNPVCRKANSVCFKATSLCPKRDLLSGIAAGEAPAEICFLSAGFHLAPTKPILLGASHCSRTAFRLLVGWFV